MEEHLFPQKQQQQPTNQLTTIATRLKLAEERYTNLQKRNQLTEAGLLALERDMKAELRVVTKQLVDTKRKISEMHMKLDAMTGELASVVQRHEFTTVERYIDMWQPMKFLTVAQAKQLLKR